MLVEFQGSPPRMRGTAIKKLLLGAGVRITPAHAGNSLMADTVPLSCGYHPRACGEQSTTTVKQTTHPGSPPRMRGTGLSRACKAPHHRITPAHAGNSAEFAHFVQIRRDHPRACGEQLLSAYRRKRSPGSPPRMRGTVDGQTSDGWVHGITPAHAGNRLLKLGEV